MNDNLFLFKSNLFPNREPFQTSTTLKISMTIDFMLLLHFNRRLSVAVLGCEDFCNKDEVNYIVCSSKSLMAAFY